ncbi:MAG: delta-60 repeat domain-containing protein [Gaiellaceae bacterium]
MARRFVLWTAAAVAVAVAAVAALLVAGHRGGGFGNGGKATGSLTGASWEFASALVLGPDGNLVVAGCHCPPPGENLDDGLVLSRYDGNGHLDRGFSSGGSVTTAIGNGAGTWALVRQRDGKLVAAAATGKGVNSRFALVRYGPDGRLDRSFGTGGVVTTAIGRSAAAEALVLQPDGKLVAAGYSGLGASSRFALARYDRRGRLDPSFGSAGTVTTAIGKSAVARAVLVQPDGELVAAGSSGTSPDRGLALARYDRNGRLDPGFGSGGTVTTAIRKDAVAQALLLQPDGKLVAAGRGGSRNAFAFALARYDRNGRLDPSFGSRGTVTTPIGDSAGAAALVLQPGGKLVAAGSAYYGHDDSDRFALARYDRSGRLDPGFGSGGTVTTAIGKDAGAAALVLQPDGKLVAAGYRGDGRNFTFGLVRYGANGGLDR